MLDILHRELVYLWCYFELHPDIRVVDFDFFSLDIFNRGENSNSVMMTLTSGKGFTLC